MCVRLSVCECIFVQVCVAFVCVRVCVCIRVFVCLQMCEACVTVRVHLGRACVPDPMWVHERMCLYHCARVCNKHFVCMFVYL